ncbi:MAG: hypothetical protein KC478_17405, partial [Bacteriovoracaceae bacterium]|nr:hypothetical protein [Bacteriovoracaceae bacterium]
RMLKNYHKDVPNYFDHLVKIELERGLALMNEFDQWNKKNEALARALRITHFAKTSGVLIPCSGMQGVSTDDPSYELLNNICKLRSDDLGPDEALEHIGELLLRDDFELYLSVISDFLDSHDLGDGFDKLISENPRIKANVIELLNKSKTGMGKIDIAKIARQMGIINKEEFSNIEKGVLVSYLAPPVSIGAKDTVCSYYGANKVKLTSEDLDQGVFEDFNALDALKCIGIHDQKLAHSVLSTAKMHKDKKMRMQALFTLSSLMVKDSKVEAFLNESLVSPKTQDEKLIAFTTAARLGLDSKKFWDTFDQFIKSDRKITWNGYTGTEREVAGDYFGDIKFKDYNDLKKYQDKFGNDLSSWPVAAALLKLEPREYMKFLKDPATSNQFEIRENFYNELVYSDRDDEIPYEIIPILIEDIQKRDDSTDIYYVSAATERMKLSETQKSELLNDVLNAQFSNEDLQGFVWNFPTQIKGESKTEFMMKLHQRDINFFKSEVQQYVHGLNKITPSEKEALRPLLSSDDIWLKMKLKELGVE